MSLENVTLRPKNKWKTISSSDIDDTFMTSPSSPSSNYSTTHSLPDLTTENKSDIIANMNRIEEQVRILKIQLESAHSQIDELSLKNISLKKVIQAQKQEITNLKASCSSTPKTDTKQKTTLKKKQAMSCRKSLDFANTETSKIRTSMATEKATKNDKHDHEANKIPGKTLKVPKIVLIGDEYVRGISRQLIESRMNKWNDCYTVTCLSKPGASSSQILNSIPDIAATSTREDIVIVSVGSNDKNPYKLFYELCIALDKLSFCKQIYVLKVQNNPFLNVNMLNNYIKLIVQNLTNCKFVNIFDKSYCNTVYKKNASNYAKAFCNKLNTEIDYLQYKDQFLSSKQDRVKTPLSPLRIKYRQETILHYFNRQEPKNNLISLRQENAEFNSKQQTQERYINNTFRY